MDQIVTIEDALKLIKQLSLIDKVRFIKQIAPQIEYELTNIQSQPRKSLRGLWRGSNVSELDITQMRQEVWANFPRKDI
jgi:hypothetical protein